MKNRLNNFRKFFFIVCLGLYIYFWLQIIFFEAAVLVESKFPPGYYFGVFSLVVIFIFIFSGPLLVSYLINYFLKNKNNLGKNFLLLLISIFFSLFYLIYLVLLVYHLRGGFSFDWSFFWFNRSEALTTLSRVSSPASQLSFFLLLFLIFGVFFVVFKKIFFYFKPKKDFLGFIGVIFLFNFLVLIFNPLELRGEMITFIDRSFFSRDKAGVFYSEDYDQYILEQDLNNLVFSENFDKVILGDKIFFIHLESVNSLLVNEEITPNLMVAGKQGIFFPYFYSSSVQTLRSQESILCGLPPSLNATIIDKLSPAKINQIACLPQLLKEMGYHTLFFKDDSLEFARTGEFMLNIGFDEVHNSDIMQPNDPKLKWGFREDIFYQRVFEYLDKHYREEKVFVYIAVSATNHYPFEVIDERYQETLPFRPAVSFKERLANTTFVQDAYLGQLLKEQLKNYLNDSSFFIFGDQSWPAGIHPNNIFNERGWYEENFLTFFLFIPPQNQAGQYEVGRVVEGRYSQMDILPTIMDLWEIENNNLLGNSFASKILKDKKDRPTPEKAIVMVQPYGGGFINIIKYPDKYIFDVSEEQLLLFDLAADPLESEPQIFNNPADYFSLISDFFNK